LQFKVYVYVSWVLGVMYSGPRSVCAERNTDAVEYHAGLNWQMPNLNSFYYCRHRSMIKVIHKPDPSLTVRLSEVTIRVLQCVL